MKILFSKNSFAGPISGADEIAVTYAIELKKAGHAASMLLVQPPSRSDPLAARLKAGDVGLHTLASTAFSRSLATARRVAIRAMRVISPAGDMILSNSRKVVFNLLQHYHDACCDYLKRLRPDVIHVLTPDPGAVMLIRAAHDSNIPVVYQEVGIPFDPPGFEQVYERFTSVLPLCTAVGVLSPCLANELKRVLPHVSPAHVLPLISLDHNGVPKPLPASEVVTFGFSARLEHLKGPMRLLEAFRIAHGKRPDIRLKLAGQGSQRQEFIDARRRLGLEQACHLVGVYKTLDDRHSFMSSFDVFVLPSLTEGTPNVIIEAMAQGKAIIATAVGGIPDLVSDDVGILVPPNNDEALAAAMIRIAVDDEMRQTMGVAARLKYEQLFTPEAVLPVLEDFYEQVVNAHRSCELVGNNGDGWPTEPRHPWVYNSPRVSRKSAVWLCTD